MKHNKKLLIVLLLTMILLGGWGSAGHKIINRRSTYSFPQTMSFLNWADSLAKHASDADIRRPSDPNEAPRHYIDIDNYPEFVATGRIPQDLDSLIAIHGSKFVYENGILPFSIQATTDSVKKYFQLNNFQKAMLQAADLGHYIGDGHNPLHITRNYDGQYTNQNGVHSRYETQMINRDSGNIIYEFDEATYVTDKNQFVFDFLYFNYQYVDSVLRCDSIARSLAGGYNDNYYEILWELSANFTVMLFNNASHFLSDLIYTAWIDAGSPVFVSSLSSSIPGKFYLGQNYPNPFNPVTKINFDIPDQPENGMHVRLVLYDVSGKEITTLVDEQLQPGAYEVQWNASSYPSGTYFYRLSTANYSEARRMILLK